MSTFVFEKRALHMPSGVVYETGMNRVERRVIFQNARIDLLELLISEGRTDDEIARALSVGTTWVSAMRAAKRPFTPAESPSVAGKPE